MAAETLSNAVSNISKYLPVKNPTQSFWHRDLDALSEHRSTEALPKHSDVVIIGAGYAGIATAYHLVKDRRPEDPELSITILEARSACSGATGRNGGHVRPDLYGHIPDYIEKYGLDAAVELAEFEIAHVWAIKELIEKENIDCDFTLTRSMDVFCNPDAAANAKESYDKMASHRLSYMKDVFFHYGPKAEAISGVTGAKACASYTAGTVWPYKLFLHLTKILLDADEINLQTKTPVTSITPSQDNPGYDIATDRGSIHATKIVHATNAYISSLLPQYSRSIVPCKGICSRIHIPDATSPGPYLTNSYVIRTADDNTLCYLIPRTDGSIVVGGGTKKFRPFKEHWYNNVDDSVLIDVVKDFFDGYMQRTFPSWAHTNAEVDKIWTGVMGYSYDSLAHVGEVPDQKQKGQYVLAGFNGHGMPVIWLAAKGLAKMIREDKSIEEVGGLPRLIKTTKDRLDKAWNGPEGGDILEGLQEPPWTVPANPVKI